MDRIAAERMIFDLTASATRCAGATMFDPGKLTLPANVPEKYLHEGRALNHEETKRMLANYLGKLALVDDCVAKLVKAMDAPEARG